MTCDRCGSDMKTMAGSIRFSEWTLKKDSDDEDLLCSDCRADLSEADDREIDININENDNGIEFTVGLVNPTIESVSFSLKREFFAKETQWNDMSSWKNAKEDNRGTVGTLIVLNEHHNIVFEHEFKHFFSHNVKSTRLNVSRENTVEFTVEWTKNGEKKKHRPSNNTDSDRYVADPTTTPYDHKKLTAVFYFEVKRNSEWNQYTETETIHLQ